ncbi:MAG TPA: hypothetical protein VD997_04535 [Phycisphaerales bacterium]|nr:hypothetical protein [Phycisphaerales bacterium]
MAQTPQHVRLENVRRLLLRSESEPVAILCYGDSRSSWTRHRVPGAIYRKWDLKWSALYCEGNTANVGTEDGLGQALYGLQGVNANVVAPGTLSSGSGIMNRYPSSFAEQWVQPGTDYNLYTTLFASVASTAGFAMHSTSTGAPGGTYYRGEPSQGRPIASVEYFALSDNRPWLGLVLGYEFNGDVLTPWQEHAEFDVPSAPTATPRVTTIRLEGDGSAGTNARVVMAYRFSEWHQYAGRGHNWLGTRINYAGNSGCVLGVVAQGGWSLTDHLPMWVDGVYNPDWKYGEAELSEWYAHTMRSPTVLLRWEVGANPTLNFQYEQNVAEIRTYTRVAVERSVAALRAAGAQEVVVELVGPWPSAGEITGPGSRSARWTQAYRELAQEQGWSFYDQINTLNAGGYMLAGILKPQYRFDAAHQNFDGMNLLGQLEWAAITSAPLCGTSDFNGDGDSGTDQDIEAFFACIGGHCCATCNSYGADFNGDGDTGTDQDIEAFFRVLGGGAC